MLISPLACLIKKLLQPFLAGSRYPLKAVGKTGGLRSARVGVKSQ